MKKLIFLLLIPYVSFASGFVKYTGEGQFNSFKPDILKNHKQFHNFDFRYDINKDIYVGGRTDLFFNNIYAFGEYKTKRVGINTVGIKAVIQLAGKNGSEYNNTIGRNAGDITLAVKDYFALNNTYNVVDVYYKSHYGIYPKEIGAQIYSKIDKIKNISFEVKANAFYEFKNNFDESYTKFKLETKAKKELDKIKADNKIAKAKNAEIKKISNGNNNTDIKSLIDEWKSKAEKYQGSEKEIYLSFLNDTKEIKKKLCEKLPDDLKKYKDDDLFLNEALKELLYSTYSSCTNQDALKKALLNSTDKLYKVDSKDFINNKSSYGAGVEFKMTYRPIEALSIISGMKMKFKNVNYYAKSNLVEVSGKEFTYSIEPNITFKHTARVNSFTFDNSVYFSYEYNGKNNFKMIPESSIKYDFLRNFMLKVSAKAIVNNLRVSTFNVSGQMEYKW
ncbi:hypothetical protein [Caviibacter abscessus]|uniref:hypothetical protein n=1 Tax=Caviibacter abscessus TaxID=1766719 RepID=UPI00083374B1|nr:hypothetical protein [Caviibacter abscessus]